MKTFVISLIVCLNTLAAYACGGYGHSMDYTAHEWGTFTSIQGTDGIPIAWQSLIVGDLPDFVYNRTRPADAQTLGIVSALLAKGAMAAPQRIETPVIYFYSAQPRTVDVRVSLPQGTITEWYPQITKFGPVPADAVSPFIDPARRNDRFIEWKNVELQPKSTHPFLLEKRPSHYYAARETDAVPVRVRPSGLPKTAAGEESGLQYEKFLFYRGVATFPSPLQARASSERTVTLKNLLNQPLKHLFVIDQRAGNYAFSYHAELPGNGRLEADLNPVSSRTRILVSRAELAQAMRQALSASGLFEKEAAAMVKTWEDAWFEERGVRILYILPEQWVNAAMPLQLTPAPAGLKRVFVGRAELFTPGLEQTLTSLVDTFATASAEQKPALVKSVRELRLGRFTQAAFERVIRIKDEKSFTSAASGLRSDALMPEPSASASPRPAGAADVSLLIEHSRCEVLPSMID